MEAEEVFFVMFAPFFISMIVLCGRQGGACVEERDTCEEEGACVEEY